ncbi:energy transducer TonB [Pontibacter anaerobius]|uniref:Energy transducer TonB n=1 Tax=Pontibacter anaerobius TaxID=2993940 RepID=A0ABT3RHM4_9BACT|nr:energy transducer TonB [Pontibacter anaerobius]MCX2741353.1 energy transducer TonB [Pontibacter anaerobius]
MEESYFLSMTFNNIVFRGRNKAYGAYYLRRKYSKHMLLAATLATATFSGALVGPLVDTIFFSDPVKYVKPTYTVVEPYTFILPEPPKPEPEPAKAAIPPPAPKPEKQEATEKFTKIKVVDNGTRDTETVPDQSALSEANIGTKKVEGIVPEIPSVTLPEEPPTGIADGTGEAPLKNEPFVHVDQMPQFKNGDGALMEYLSKKLRYPKAAQSNDVEGIVVVTFVVAANGEISDVEILKGLGYGTEEEAARVIKGMPKWEPGRQNGHAVPVRYTLPIRFRMH